MTRYIFLTFIILSSPLCLLAQKVKQKNKVKISLLHHSDLYVDKMNIIQIKGTTDSISNLKITLSQGSFSGFENHLFFVIPNKIGNITISIFKQNGKQNKLLVKQDFRVVITEEQKTFNTLSIKPEISLCGYYGGKIPLGSIKQLTRLTINQPYKIKSATVYISGPHSSDTQVHKLTSNNFDKGLLEVWKRLTPDSNITFDEITITDAKMKVYKITSLAFIVTKNNTY